MAEAGRERPQGASLADAAQRIADRYGVPIERARQVVSDGLHFGEVGATWLEGDGGVRLATHAELAAESFDFDPVAVPYGYALSLGTPDADSGRPLVLTVVAPSLEINLPALDRYAQAAFGAVPTPVAAQTGPQRDRGGRPPVHDWKRAKAQIFARVYLHGLPRKSELAAELWDWFGRTFATIPDLRTIERWIAELWPELEGMVKGPCELRPHEPGDET